MTKTVLIVGDSFHTLREYILNHGMEYVVLKDITTTKYPEKHLKRRVVCDFSSWDKIKLALETAKKKYQIDAVISTYEKYIIPAAMIANELGLPGLPIESAKACTDKVLMRECFAKAQKKISPDYKEVTRIDEVTNFAKEHAYPIILKPANLAKSLLVTKNRNEKELIENYQKIVGSIEKVYNKYAPGRKPKILIEEFMEGPIHSVDAFVDFEGEPHVLENVVDYQTGYDIGFDDNFHYSRLLPSKLPVDEIESIRQVAAIGCRALGMKSSPAHVEIIRTPKGPMVVEIGARNGGYRERMHWLANGIDVTGNALALAFNQPLDITPKKNDSVGVFEIFPKVPGIFAGINNENQLQALPSFNYLSIKAKPGSFAGKSGDGYKMCAVVILHNDNSEQFSKDVEFVDTAVSAATNLPNATVAS